MVHIQTADCVEKATSLIDEDSPDSLRYASLQLRMGIEFLFYELIPLYEEELPDDITITKWQPRQIIDAILECDPDADQDGRFEIQIPPKVGESNSQTIQRDIKSPNKQILRKHYHKLGSYLHAPVDLIDPEIKRWKAALKKTITLLEEYCCSNQAIVNVRTLVRKQCICGRMISCNVHGIRASGRACCPDPECRARYDVTIDGEQFLFSLREESFFCPNCKTENFVPEHRISDGLEITCYKCEHRVVLRSTFRIDPLQEEVST